MSQDDWFRNKTWNSRIEKAFFEKLSRARSQRDQYLVIQANMLSRSHPKVALQLVDHYFDTKKGDFDDVRALLARVNAHETLKNRAEVLQGYKKILAREAEFPGHKTTAYVDFPYLVAREEIEDEYGCALEVLENRQSDIAFPLDRFMWHASHAIIASKRGDESATREHAKLALDAAEAQKSGFRYHQNLGLVGKEHKPVVKTLVRLARD